MRSLEAKHHARLLLVLGLKDEDQQEKYAHSVNSLVCVNVCVSVYVCICLSYVCVGGVNQRVVVCHLSQHSTH